MVDRHRLLALVGLAVLLLGFGVWRFAKTEKTRAVTPTTNAVDASGSSASGARLEDSATRMLPWQRPDAGAKLDAEAMQGSGARSIVGARISGCVRSSADRCAVAGVRVLCWRHGDFDPKPLARSANEPSPVREHEGVELLGLLGDVVSDAAGRFEFTGLDPGATYRLSARAPAWILVQPPEDVIPSDQECSLFVQRLYVVQLAVQDENGESLGEQTCEFTLCEREDHREDCRAIEILAPPPVPEQPGSGITTAVSFEDECPGTRREYFFASRCDVPLLGPIEVLVCSAGFVPTRFALWAVPGDTGVPLSQIRLPRMKTSALVVEFDCPCSAPRCSHLFDGMLELEPVEAGHGNFTRILSGNGRRERFDGVPAGSWRARVRARSGSFAFPPTGEPAAELVIAEGEQAIFRVPVGNLGALQFQLGDGSKLTARGDAQLECVGVSGPGARVPLWPGVLLRGIEAGPHEFRIVPSSTDPGAGHVPGSTGSIYSVDIEAKAGETVIVPVQMP